MEYEKLMEHEGFKVLGFQVKDVVTLKEGVATSLSFDLYGCVQILIRPREKGVFGEKGKQEAAWVDLSRIEITDKKRVMEPVDFRQYQGVKIPGPEIKPV